MISAIKIYRLCLSPYFGNNCKYHPTCSEYAIDALSNKCLIKAIFLIVWRLLRCNPISYGGFDPVNKSPQKG